MSPGEIGGQAINLEAGHRAGAAANRPDGINQIHGIEERTLHSRDAGMPARAPCFEDDKMPDDELKHARFHERNEREQDEQQQHPQAEEAVSLWPEEGWIESGRGRSCWTCAQERTRTLAHPSRKEKKAVF